MLVKKGTRKVPEKQMVDQEHVELTLTLQEAALLRAVLGKVINNNDPISKAAVGIFNDLRGLALGYVVEAHILSAAGVQLTEKRYG